MTAQTLPGFLLTIEDNQTAAEPIAAIKDVHLIYGVLPETMKYEDEDGNLYDKFIEPNKPLLISNGGKEEAIKTLEVSDMALTREMKNMIRLMPNDATIALCRITDREGNNPIEGDLVGLHEALDFAFEETENYPIKEIYVAGLSLDKSVALNPNEFKVTEIESAEEKIDMDSFKGMFSDIKTIEGSTSISKSISATVSIVAERSGESLTQADGKGVYNKFSIKVNGQNAEIITSTEQRESLVFESAVDYTNPDTPVFGTPTSPEGINASVSIADEAILLTLTGSVRIVVGENEILEMNGTTLVISDLGKAEMGTVNQTSVSAKISKVSFDADILTRIMRHNSTITATQNNCLTFLAPEPPRNASTKAIREYVERCKSLQMKVRDRLATTTNGKKIDLGMFLSVPVGVNRLDGLGGVAGFPKATVSSMSGNAIVTKKPTTAFTVGDKVEIYTNKGLDIIQMTATVVAVNISITNTTEIILDKTIDAEITMTSVPTYIMNVNNKDDNGNYMAIQYSNICKQAGVNRSPAGIAWPGECQVAFSEAQKNALNALKFCVLVQKHGTIQGEIDKSQLMTSVTSQFQDYENIAVIYNLVSGSKAVGMKYKGLRVNDGTDLAMIKTEIEDGVFNPGVNKFITSGYDLKIRTANLQTPGGRKEKALFIDFAVTEIQTLKLLRMSARLN